jgi:hypothetical protein
MSAAVLAPCFVLSGEGGGATTPRGDGYQLSQAGSAHAHSIDCAHTYHRVFSQADAIHLLEISGSLWRETSPGTTLRRSDFKYIGCDCTSSSTNL